MSKLENNITIDPTAIIHPTVIIEGTITIGKYSRIGAGCIITGNNIVIGDYVTMFCNITIRGANIEIHDYVNMFDHVNIESGRGWDKMIVGEACWLAHGAVMHGTQLGRNVFVGLNASFNYNCKIGNDCIIMSGTACGVDMEVPESCIVEGVPARIIKTIVTDEDRIKLAGLIPRQWAEKHAEVNKQGGAL